MTRESRITKLVVKNQKVKTVIVKAKNRPQPKKIKLLTHEEKRDALIKHVIKAADAKNTKLKAITYVNKGLFSDE